KQVGQLIWPPALLESQMICCPQTGQAILNSLIPTVPFHRQHNVTIFFYSDNRVGSAHIRAVNLMKKHSPVSRSGRFSGGPAEDVARFTESISYDWRLWRQDIVGSKAHARMLQK